MTYMLQLQEGNLMMNEDNILGAKYIKAQQNASVYHLGSRQALTYAY